MTPEHVAEQLLAHGSLNWYEFVDVTGWDRAKAREVLNTLIERGVVTETADGTVATGRFWLTSQMPIEQFEPGTRGRLRRRMRAPRAPERLRR